ncbi:MAG TPA: Ig-like domain-containing protein [Anaerolineae bacterium]|nr:Ig-like domain-containing protein [Anaerolineae bacterium]HQH39847.1 Ig-like domain-containing protein [Anaerolineae bacterium]
MKFHKSSTWIIVSIGLIILGGLVLLPGTTARSASVQPPDISAASTEMGAVAAIGDLVSITKDEGGYTVWTYEYPDSWCVMYSRIRWPFDIGAQDPTDLSETSLKLTFSEQPYYVTEDGPFYTDPTWAVALNGKPGEWNIIGAIGTVPWWPEKIPVEQEVPFDYTELIDGENNLWFQQQDFCNCTDVPDCACTCYELTKLQLRARVDLEVKEVWPAPETRNVPVEQDATKPLPEIRVRFTTVVSEATVNENTFQVYYLNDKQEPVYVDGKTRRINEVEYAFVPNAPLKDGIRYEAHVWGETDALIENHDDWVQDLSGGPLEEGESWSFWTLPQLEVRLEPVQVLEGDTLVVGKPTALRVFLSSANLHTDVWYKDLWEYVDVEDVQLLWGSPSGMDSGAVSWRTDGTEWHFEYTKETARRYRLNDKAARLGSQDSVNYYGFIPQEVGTYSIRAVVLVPDSHGKSQRFVDVVTPSAVQTRWLNVHSRALAVGGDYGRTGTVDLSAAVLGQRSGIQAIYPVPNVRLAQTASAVPYYAPVASSVWSAAPAGDLQLLKALMELSAMCAATSDCDFMVGFVPTAWLGDIGLTSPRQSWYSMLIQNAYYDPFRFIAAHEGGHLYGFEHDTNQGGAGYDVRHRLDRRISTALMEPRGQRTLSTINSFMNVDPVESPPPERLWIEWLNYSTLRAKLTTASQALQQTATADSLLLATGTITPATGDVALDPWYQLEPGDWEAPLAGPYRLVFLDNAGQEIVGYTRTFSSATTLQPAGRNGWDLPADAPAPFALKVPYPAATARIQIRRTSDDALLAERTVSATPPTIAITPPASTTWTGPQPIAWQSDPGETRRFLVQVSTDNGATWEAQAIHLPGTVFTLETASMLNTTQALVRVLATDGLNTASDVAGPFTIANPVGVDYVSPTPDATNVNVDQPLYAGFRAAMDATTIHSATFTLSGGPYGTASGLIRYDAESREATFIPQTRLAYSTTYTAHVSAAIHTLDGTPLSAGATWSFTTEPDVSPPRPHLLSPQHGALNVPRNAVVAVAWDRPLDAATLTTATFQMAEMRGAVITGSVAYDAATHTATFTPDALLAPYTAYVVTLTAGISDTLGNATFAPTVWAFTTGNAPGEALAFANSYADWGNDSNGDGLYEQLVIRVGVQVTATGAYVLRGSLTDADGGEITWAFITRTLTTGAHFLDLAFDGTAIGGHNADGPYTLTDLTLTHINSTAAVPPTTSQRDAYHTFAYAATRFPAPLRFGGLPDVVLIPGTITLNAFNVHDYAQSITRTSAQISYTVMLNTNPKMDVALQTSGAVYLTPEEYWQGSTFITIRASDGVYTAQDTFEATVGWPHAVYLPVVLRGGSMAPRDAWITVLHDDFEASTFSWSRYASIDTTDQPDKFYQWDRRDCRAHSGQYSAWAYGGGDDGSQLACGADYPQALYTLMYRESPVNLKYVAQGEYSAKVWLNLNPGHEVCLKVAVISEGECRTIYDQPVDFQHGICRSGQTNGWEDLTLNLVNVPELGSVLGEERVCVGVTFQTQYGAVRPEGAYVDDVNLRICPEGLTGYCATSFNAVTTLTNTPPYAEIPATMTLSIGNIGGYPEAVSDVALAVDGSGRIHALWTGQLNPAFRNYVFYSSSTDGVNWTPYQILSYWGGREPQIAVDNVHGRVHLAYANDDGIIHRTVVDGAVSAPTVVVAPRTYYAPGSTLPSGGVAWPSLTVAEQTGVAYLTWDEVYYVKLDAITYDLRHRTWHAYWNGAPWSAPLRKINDEDTFYSSIEAAPDGRAMLAWFQRWQQSSGKGLGPGDPIVARTAYGTTPGSFPLRQATHALYPEPERDESILLTYSGGDDTFVLASEHLMWPGHSLVYRYVWKDGAWSEPLDVAENTSGWGVPYYVGAATDTPLIRYVYNDNDVLTMRTETNGVLAPAQNLADYLTTRGYTMTGNPLAYFTDAAGGLHMIIVGEKNGVAGFYYVKP